jgi:hypothetical protein
VDKTLQAEAQELQKLTGNIDALGPAVLDIVQKQVEIQRRKQVREDIPR